MVSDSELVERLRDVLRNSDLDTATAGSVRRQLEEQLGVDLSDRKAFIREQIDDFLQTLNGAEEESVEDNKEVDEEANGGVEEEEEGEDESEGKGNRKGREEKKVKRGRGGFNKVCSLSPQLQDLVGVSELARTEVVKRLWAYIREKELQDPKNKRNIRCDDALRAIFRVNAIDMFQMNKALSKHIWPLASEDVDEQSADQKPMVNGDNVADTSSEEGNTGKEEEDQGRGEEGEEADAVAEKESRGRSKKRGHTKVEKNVKKRGTGFTKLCRLSPQLQEFIGLPEMARTEVVKKLWVHIREKNLQDPNDRRKIICDESLQSLFNVDSIDMFKMNRVLSKHIWPLNEEDAPNKSSLIEEQDMEERIGDSEEPDHEEKRQKKGST